MVLESLIVALSELVDHLGLGEVRASPPTEDDESGVHLAVDALHGGLPPVHGSGGVSRARRGRETHRRRRAKLCTSVRDCRGRFLPRHLS